MKRKMTLMPLFRDESSVPLQPLKEVEICFTIAPLVAVQIHMPYEGIDTLLVLDTDCPIGNLAQIRGIPLLYPDMQYRLVLHKEKVPPKRFFFKQIGYTFGHRNIVDVRDEEGDPLIPDISIHFLHSNYRLFLHRSPFTVKFLAKDDDEDGNEDSGVAYEGKPIVMDALECSFFVVGNLLADHSKTPTSNGRLS